MHEKEGNKSNNLGFRKQRQFLQSLDGTACFTPLLDTDRIAGAILAICRKKMSKKNPMHVQFKYYIPRSQELHLWLEFSPQAAPCKTALLEALHSLSPHQP